jgi:hypothetical protein
VSFIPVVGLRRDGPSGVALPSYIASSGYSPDGVSDLSNRAPARALEAMFTPDGVSFIPVTSLRREGPAARLLPSYIATSGYSPDGVSDLSNRAPARVPRAMFTPDGVSWVEAVR